VNKSHNAFLLTELLVAILLFIFLITISIPRFSFFKKWHLTNEIEHLFVTFTFLQQKAMAENKKQELTFYTKQNCYRFLQHNIKSTTHHLAHGMQFNFLPEAKGPPSLATKPITQAITFPAKNNIPVATFFPNGAISPGTVYLTDEKKKLMKALTCPISHVSYIRKYTYAENRWVSW
jgi:type II secretory pathway pseudopilin PulG